jgi:hypothetical protein
MKETLFEENKNQNIFTSTLNIFFPTKKFTINVLLFSLIFSLLIFFLIPAKFSSKAVLAPAQDLNEALKQQSGLGSFGNILGIDTMSGNLYKFNQSIEILSSFRFFKLFVEKYELKDSINSEPIMFKGKTLQDAYKIFHEQIVVIDFDARRGMLTISAQHSSQEFSKYLLDNMIKEVNLSVKNEDIEKSKLSIEFLEQKIKETDLSEIKEGLSDLVQKQIETIMIAESSPEYVFKTIDSAIVPERNNRNDYLIMFPVLLLFTLISVVLLLKIFFRNR